MGGPFALEATGSAPWTVEILGSRSLKVRTFKINNITVADLIQNTGGIL